jgi:hypothetical protein
MFKLLGNFFLNLNRYTWRWYYAFFFPVSWKQDCNFINDGYDILTVKRDRGYFRGTHKQYQKTWH